MHCILICGGKSYGLHGSATTTEAIRPEPNPQGDDRSAYHYGSHAQLKAHVNFSERLKTLRGLTPYEHICKVWTTQPNRSD